MNIWIDWDKIFPSHNMRYFEGKAVCIKCCKTFEQLEDTDCVRARNKKKTVKPNSPLGLLVSTIKSIKRKK